MFAPGLPHRASLRLAFVTAALALGVAWPDGAAAQAASDSVAARALFQEGVELSDAGSWPEAIERFRRALALRDSAVIAYNLGVALAHEGQPVEAAERFRRVVRDEEADEALRVAARSALEAAEAAMAWIVTSWDGDASDVELRVDGHARPVALLGTGMPVDPGAHDIILVRGESEVAVGSITVAGGERAPCALTTLEVPLAAPEPVDEAEAIEPPVGAVAGVAASRAPDAAAGSNDALWIGLGVGAGVLVVGGVIVLAVVLTPTPEARPYSGSLGTVELGR